MWLRRRLVAESYKSSVRIGTACIVISQKNMQEFHGVSDSFQTRHRPKIAKNGQNSSNDQSKIVQKLLLYCGVVFPRWHGVVAGSIRHQLWCPRTCPSLRWISGCVSSMTYTHTQLLNVADSGLYWCVEVSSQLHKWYPVAKLCKEYVSSQCTPRHKFAHDMYPACVPFYITLQAVLVEGLANWDCHLATPTTLWVINSMNFS